VRQLTRRVLAVVLLALGAVPGTLGSGEPYYLQATPSTGPDAGADTPAAAGAPAVNATPLSGNRYPYLSAALASPTNRSSGYQTAGGLKEAFTHSPFDEVAALRTRNPNASVPGGDAVRIRFENRTYVVSVVRANATGGAGSDGG
jgi:hypothetical protein